MENIIAVVLLVMAILIMSVQILAVVMFNRTYKALDKRNEIREKEILYNTPLNFDELDILDKIINEEFYTYQIMHLAHRDNLYINPELQQQIITDLLKSVLDKISPDLYKKLGLFYDKDHIDDLIFNKIKLSVINYTVEINGTYKK